MLVLFFFQTEPATRSESVSLTRLRQVAAEHQRNSRRWKVRPPNASVAFFISRRFSFKKSRRFFKKRHLAFFEKTPGLKNSSGACPLPQRCVYGMHLYSVSPYLSFYFFFCL